MKPQSLIDILYKESFDNKPQMGWRSNVAMRHALENARRFIADEPMSAFMADLSTQAFTKGEVAKGMVARIADSLRLQARLPHPTIWIEYHLREYQRRSMELRNQTHLNPDESPLREGWLIQQHPSIRTAYLMHSFTCSDIPDYKGMNVWTFPFAFGWCCDDSALPWESIFDKTWKPEAILAEGVLPSESKWSGERPKNGKMGFVGKSGKKLAPHVCVSSMLYGHGSYHRDNVDCVKSPLIEDPASFPGASDYYTYLFTEWAGVMRRAWSLLATIDNLPVSYAAIRQSKGFLGGHRIRRYLDYHTITLRIPERKDARVLARESIAVAHRKRHNVRAHWRDDWRHPPNEKCAHIWEMVGDDPDTIYCTECNGRQFQIHEHERGDASLGWVYHDYDLKH